MPGKTSNDVAKFTSYVNLERNCKYELQYTQWLLTILGIWPMVSNNVTKARKVVSFFLITLSFSAIAFILIPCGMFMFIKMKTVKSRFIFIGPIGFRISNLLKHIFMMQRANVIKECVDHIRRNWLEIKMSDDEYVMLKSASVGRTLTSICGIFMFSSGTFFHVAMPLLKPKKVNAFNVTIRPHVYPGYDFFVDSQATPTYEIIFAIHCLCAAAGYTIVTAACNLAAAFVTHVSGQVQVIKLKLQKLHEYERYGKINDQITSIVRSHVEILQFSENIKTVLREICLVEIVLSTIVICWLEFYCLTEWENSETISIITYFLLLVSLTFNIFMYCYIGEILKEQMTYMIDWYRIPTKNILSLILIIAMARYPRNITAGGLMDLTIRSFGAIMKTSLAYLNMFRAVGM